MPAQLSIC